MMTDRPTKPPLKATRRRLKIDYAKEYTVKRYFDIEPKQVSEN